MAAEMPCDLPHRIAGWALLALCGSTILISGVASPLGRWGWTYWPWNRAWFMFSDNDGLFYKLQFGAHLEDCTDIRVDIDRWFNYPVGFETWRWNEIYRNNYELGELSRYVCRRYNNEVAEPGRRIVRLTVWDEIWPQERGRRRPLSEVPEEEKSYVLRLRNSPCPQM